MAKKKTMTKKSANRMFTTIGLCLILYCLMVLVIPSLADLLIQELNISIINNKYLYYGIAQGITILGTFIAFGFMKSAMKVKTKDYFSKSDLSLLELLIEFLSFFTFVSLAIFVTYQLANTLGFKTTLVYNIGNVLTNVEYHNIIYAISFILISPIIEEIAFRGIMLNSLSRFGKKFSLIVMALIYALAHGSFSEIIIAFWIAFILGKLALYASSIRPCIILHILFNLIIYGLSFIPESLVLYEIIFLAIIYLATLLLIVTNYKSFIKIKSNQNYKIVLSIFFKNPIAVISMILFILHSILLLFI